MCKRRRALGRRWQREYSCSGGSYAAQASVLRALLSGAELNYCIHVAVRTPITTLDGNQVLARQVFGSDITCSKSKTSKYSCINYCHPRSRRRHHVPDPWRAVGRPLSLVLTFSSLPHPGPLQSIAPVSLTSSEICPASSSFAKQATPCPSRYPRYMHHLYQARHPIRSCKQAPVSLLTLSPPCSSSSAKSWRRSVPACRPHHQSCVRRQAQTNGSVTTDRTTVGTRRGLLPFISYPSTRDVQKGQESLR